MNIKDMVKDNQVVKFCYYRDNNLWYETENGFKFPVPVEDIGTATFNAVERAILMMRYIRPHLALINENK